MSPPLAAASAFLNNAPIVAMMTPVVIEWARRHQMAASKLLIPLSYATILGSVTTMIGTSTNLTVDGLLRESGHAAEHGLLRAGAGGHPPGRAWASCTWSWSPPAPAGPRGPGGAAGRAPARVRGRHARRAGPAAWWARASRRPACASSRASSWSRSTAAGHLITPVSPDEVVAAGDRLVFAGVVSTIVDLQRIPGSSPVPREDGDARPARRSGGWWRRWSRAPRPLVPFSVRDVGFRTVYDAAVIAVHRNGERVGGQDRRDRAAAGDTLLLQAAPHFLRAHRNSPDFYLVSELDADGPPCAARRPGSPWRSWSRWSDRSPRASCPSTSRPSWRRAPWS